MEFTYSEEQEKLRRAVRDFLEKECPEQFVKEMARDTRGYSPAQWQQIAEQGWLGLIYPKEYGGSGGNCLDMSVLYEEFGRAIFPGPHFSTVVLCGLIILQAASEQQKTEYLPKIAGGKCVMALALNEEESAWDGKAWLPEGISMRARQDGEEYVLNGKKLFVHDAGNADYLVVPCRTRATTLPSNGITLFLINAKDPGITITPMQTIAADNQCAVTFKDVRIGRSNIIGKPNAGWEPLAQVLKMGAVLLCAQMLGNGQKLLELTLDHARTRVQFDMPIGVNQYVQDHCVKMYEELDGIKLATYYAAWKLSEGQPAELESAIAKARASEASERIGWAAHQVFAGAGYTLNDSVIPLYTRRAKMMQVYLGDARFHKEKITAQLEKWPRPEQPKGAPMGLWNNPATQEIPQWWNDFTVKCKPPV